nr:hypothetical protein [Tanacetum cinerariifolium]
NYHRRQAPYQQGEVRQIGATQAQADGRDGLGRGRAGQQRAQGLQLQQLGGGEVAALGHEQAQHHGHVGLRATEGRASQASYVLEKDEIARPAHPAALAPQRRQGHGGSGTNRRIGGHESGSITYAEDRAGALLLNKYRPNQILERENLVPFLLGQQAALGHGDDWIQLGHNANAVVHHIGGVGGVGRDAEHALVAQGVAGVGEVADAGEERKRDNRLHDIELQLARLGGHRHRKVGAGHVEGRLVYHLRDDRIHLAGHDAATGLQGGQVYFVEAGAGAAAEQAQVVADFAELHGAGRRIYAGADGGGAHVDFGDEPARVVDAQQLLAQVGGEGVKLVAHTHGHGVLQLGAAHLEYVFELFAFLGKGIGEGT